MNGEELKEYNIQNVVEKTLECFELYGIEETTVKMVAKKSGLTTRTIQRYFHSKENLTVYVLRIFLRRVYKELKKAFEEKKATTKTGLEQLLLWQRMIQQYLRTNFKDMNSIEEIELYLIKGGDSTDLIQEYTNNVVMVRRCTTEAINRGIEDKSIRKDLDDITVDMLLGAHIGLLSRMRVSQKYNSYVPLDSEKKLTDNFEKMVLSYLKA